MPVCCLLLLCLLRDIIIFIIMLLMHSIWILVDVNGCLKLNMPAVRNPRGLLYEKTKT